VAKSGTYADTQTVAANAALDSAGINLAFGRAGTYDIVARKSGYADWTKNGVVVGTVSTLCGDQPKTVAVSVMLQRTP
jgi:hypothetical protein